MKALTKLMIAGAIILILGIGVFIAGVAMNGWKMAPHYENETYLSEGQVGVVELNVDAGKLNCSFYDGDQVEITYPVSEDFGYRVTEADGKITLSPQKQRYWFWLGWFELPEITVKIPQTSVPDLKIDLSAGKVVVGDGTFQDVTIKISAGTLNVGEIACATFDCSLSAGNATVGGMVCDRADIDLSAGSFTAKSICCPLIGLDLSAGNAKLNVVGSEEDYNVSVDKSAGSCNLSSRTASGSDKKLTVNLSAGDVNVQFTEQPL